MARDTEFNQSTSLRGPLTPELLDSTCTANPALVWRGLYQDLTGMLIREESKDLDDRSWDELADEDP